jgi:hypothetical protein
MTKLNHQIDHKSLETKATIFTLLMYFSFRFIFYCHLLYLYKHVFTIYLVNMRIFLQAIEMKKQSSLTLFSQLLIIIKQKLIIIIII